MMRTPFSGCLTGFLRRWLRSLPASLTALSLLTVSVTSAQGRPTDIRGGGEDLQLVRATHFDDPGEFAHYHGPANNEQALANRRRSFVARYNPVSLVLKGGLLAYQKMVSRQLARQCPYEITCSNFSKLAIEEFGMFKGVFISADRIMRCNRIGLLDVRPLSINPATGAIIDPPNLYR
jgi:putative component of membrane protein insertase Oxa1/YidC/SpoIIIJ protein YidD